MKIKANLAVSESGFIFDPGTGDSYSLNPIGTEILSLLKEGIDMKDIKKSILKKYDVEESTVEKDIIDFINIMKQYRLIEVADEA